MEQFSIHSCIAYCIFGMLLFYQQLHFKNFRGSSKVFESLLMTSVALGMLTRLVYLGIYAWSASFIAAILIFVIGIVAAFVYRIFEGLFGTFGLSLLGFIGWPIAAGYMFRTIP